MPALGLASYRYMLARVSARSWASISASGPRAACWRARCRRGTGRTIEAAILLADLRGFTSLAGREPPARVVAWLDQHLEAIGEAVAAQEGEVLKFLGDGLLAVFPVEEAADAARRLPARARRCRAGAGRDRRTQCRPPRPAASRNSALDVVLHYRRGGLRQCRRRPPPRLHRHRPDRQRGQPHRRPMRGSSATRSCCRRRSPPAAAGPTSEPGQVPLRGCEGETEVYALRPHG